MKAVLLAVLAANLFAESWSVKIPMRDGVLLAADVYGADPAHPKPVLLSRTPYDKKGGAKSAIEYARHGYAVVIQDCRGRYASGGDYTPYNDDRQDGFDTIEWINRQPWSNGRLGMFGGSHLGVVQWLAMAEKAPGLVTIAPAFAPSSLYRVAYRDGALRLALIGSAGTRTHPPPPPRKLPAEINFIHNHLPVMHLPLARLEEAYGWSLPWMSSLLAHPAFDGFWRQTSGEQEIQSSDLPVQIVTGYYDFYHHEAVQDFFRLRNRNSKAQAQLIMGPWMHGGTNQSKTQDVDFGPDARIDLQATNLRWFDRQLKGQAPERPEPVVRYFVLGANTWRESQAWPPEEAKETSLYLRAGGVAGFAQPEADERFSEFESDPDKPVPAVPSIKSGVSRAALWSPMDYTEISSRKDVLTWTTPVLDKPVVFAGPLKADLWVETDTPDADWVVRLFAVPPKGIALPIGHGITRAAFRDSAARSSPITPGKKYALSVDLGSGAASLPAGYCLRIVIAGSSFPMYDRNLHTAEGPFSARSIRAHQKVHHRRGLASKIVLPVLPK